MTDADAKLKQALREKAQKDLDAWYEQRRILIEKQKAKNRQSEANEVDDLSSTNAEPVKYDDNRLMDCISN